MQRCIIYGLSAEVRDPRLWVQSQAPNFKYPTSFINYAPFLSLFAGVKKTVGNGQPESKDFCHMRLKSAGNIMDCMQQNWCP